jgi:hypothetical protein
VLLRRLLPLLAVALVCVPAARADADPASDILYTQRIFLPFFGGKVSSEKAAVLKQVVDEAYAKGFKIKVAVIGAANDLGGVYQLFGQPQTYAQFLGRELVFLYKGLLVTVMPQGFGVYQYKKSTAGQQALLKRIAIPKGTDGLAEAATQAVAKLAHVKIPAAPPTPGKKSGGSSSWTLIAILGGGAAVLLAMIVLGPIAFRRRRAAT